MRYLACLLGLVLAILSTSCGTDNLVRSGEGSEGRTLLSGVPFFRQDDFQCGPASLATVVNYWNGRLGLAIQVPVESIVDEIYSPTAKGVLGMDLEIYAKRHGFFTRQYSGSVSDLRKLIDQRTPPIILVDLGVSLLQANHFIVVTGYTSKGVLANTGRAENEFFTERKLDSLWKKTGYWMLVIEPGR